MTTVGRGVFTKVYCLKVYCSTYPPWRHVTRHWMVLGLYTCLCRSLGMKHPGHRGIQDIGDRFTFQFPTSIEDNCVLSEYLDIQYVVCCSYSPVQYRQNPKHASDQHWSLLAVSLRLLHFPPCTSWTWPRSKQSEQESKLDCALYRTVKYSLLNIHRYPNTKIHPSSNIDYKPDYIILNCCYNINAALFFCGLLWT